MNTLDFIEAMRKETEPWNGFIPRSRLEEYVTSNQYVLATSVGKPVGCILHGVIRRTGFMHITITAVDFDWRGRGHATDAMHKVIERTRRQNAYGVVARVAANNPSAPQFFESIGYRLARVIPTQNVRNRDINLYVCRLMPNLFDLDEQPQHSDSEGNLSGKELEK